MRLGVLSDLHHSARLGHRSAWHGPFAFERVLPRTRRALEWFAAERVEAVAVLGDVVDDPALDSPGPVLEVLASAPAPVTWIQGNHDPPELPVAWGSADPRLGWVRLSDSGATVVASGAAEVVLAHHPVLSRAGAFARRGLRYAGDVPDRAEVERQVRAGRVAQIVCGHLHAADVTTLDGLTQVAVPSVVESPGCAVLLDTTAPGSVTTFDLDA